MLRLLRNEFAEALAAVEETEVSKEPYTLTLATGLLAAPTLQELAGDFSKKFPQAEIEIIPVVNHFFGEQITVSGLLTGQDLIAQLKDRNLGERLLLPCNLLRSGEEVLLDDVTLEELKKLLQVPIDIVKSSGQDLVSCLMKHSAGISDSRKRKGE